MKTINGGGNLTRVLCRAWVRTLLLAGILSGLLANFAHAFVTGPVSPDGTDSDPACIPLQSWSFYDPTHWTDDGGYARVSSANLG
jgi:hypothetical protein